MAIPCPSSMIAKRGCGPLVSASSLTYLAPAAIALSMMSASAVSNVYPTSRMLSMRMEARGAARTHFVAFIQLTVAARQKWRPAGSAT